MSIILSFDVSSTTIGYAVIKFEDTKISFVSCDYVKPIKSGTIIDRLADTRNKIKSIINQVKPDYIAIENIISFIKGKSTANTIITLTSYNRMVSLLAHDYLTRSPELFSVMSIRHGIKLSKKLPDKSEIPELVAKHLGIQFPYIYSKKGKAKGKIKIESYDCADAIAVGLYYAFIITGKIKKPKVKK